MVLIKRLKQRWEYLSPLLRHLVLLVVVLFFIFPLGWQVYRNWDEVFPYLRQASLYKLTLSLIVAFIDLGILAFTWHLIAKNAGITLGILSDFKAFFFSNFAKRVPGVIWYVAGRAYIYRVRDRGTLLATAGIILENISLFITGLLIALIIWPQYLDIEMSSVTVVLLPSIGALILLVTNYKAVTRILTRIWSRLTGRQVKESVIQYSPQPLVLASWLLLYFMVWIVGGMSFFLFVSAFYPSVNVNQLGLLVGIATMYTLTGFVAFFVPAGMGVKEVTGAYFLARIIPLSLTIVVVLLFRLNLLLAELMWLVVSYVLVKWQGKTKQGSVLRQKPASTGD